MDNQISTFYFHNIDTGVFFSMTNLTIYYQNKRNLFHSTNTFNSNFLIIFDLQMLLNSGIEYIIFPGSTIPSCFHQYTIEPPLSFRFRNKLPVMAICVVGVLGCCFLPRSTIEYAFDLILNCMKVV
jgi:hypothetical protein